MVAIIRIISAADESVNVIFFIKILMGMMFIVPGNFFNRVRPTLFVGIRMPRTFPDPTIWKKPHRLGGFLMVIGGALFVVSAVFLPGPTGFGNADRRLCADAVYCAVL